MSKKNWFYLLEEDELKHPLEIRILCARGIMPELDLITQLINKFFGRLCHQLMGEIDYNRIKDVHAWFKVD